MFDYSIILATITIILLAITIGFMVLLPDKTYFIDPSYLKRVKLHKYNYNKIKNEILPIITSDDIKWRKWYIKEQTTDEVFYYPVKLFNKIWHTKYKLFENIIDINMLNDDNITNIYFIKINPDNYFKYSIDDIINTKKNIKLLFL